MDTNGLFGIAAGQNKTFNNLFNALPNPNSIVARVGDRVVTFDNVLSDSHVSACAQSRKAGATAQLWEIQGEAQVVEFANKVFEDLNISKIENEILDAPLYGYQIMEIYWRREIIDGATCVVPKNLIAKPRDWFAFDADGRLRFNMLDSRGATPHRKFIVIQHNANYSNPYGDAVLAKCLWPAAFKKGGLTFWIKFAQKYGMPFFIGKMLGSRNSADADDFLELLDELEQDATAVISREEDIQVLSGATAQSAAIYKDLIDFCNNEISKAILSSTLTTELQQTGSYAASQTHYLVRQDIIDSDVKLIEQAFNQLLAWTTEINFGADVEPPQFVLFPPDDVDRPLAEVVDILEKNKNIRFTKKFYQDRFGFKPDEFALVETAAPAFSAFSEFKEPIFKDQILIDAFGDKAVKNNSKNFNALTQIVTQYIDKQTNYEDAISGLSKLLPKMNTKKIEDGLTRLLFLADVAGRLSAAEEMRNA